MTTTSISETQVDNAFRLAGFPDGRPGLFLPEGVVPAFPNDFLALGKLLTDDILELLKARAGTGIGVEYSLAAHILEFISSAGYTTEGRRLDVAAVNVADATFAFTGESDYQVSINRRVRALREQARQFGIQPFVGGLNPTELAEITAGLGLSVTEAIAQHRAMPAAHHNPGFTSIEEVTTFHMQDIQIAWGWVGGFIPVQDYVPFWVDYFQDADLTGKFTLFPGEQESILLMFPDPEIDFLTGADVSEIISSAQPDATYPNPFVLWPSGVPYPRTVVTNEFGNTFTAGWSVVTGAVSYNGVDYDILFRNALGFSGIRYYIYTLTKETITDFHLVTDAPPEFTFLSLSDTPSMYVPDKILAVNDAGNALVLIDNPGSLNLSQFALILDNHNSSILAHMGLFVQKLAEHSAIKNAHHPLVDATNFLGLSDTPDTYVADYQLQVDPTGTGVLFVPSPTLIALPDTPVDYTGQAGKHLIVNSTQDGIVFTNPPGNTFAGLSDTPGISASAYTGFARNYLRVNATQTGLEYVSEPTFRSLPDTPASYTTHAGKYLVVNDAANGLAFVELPEPEVPAGGLTFPALSEYTVQSVKPFHVFGGNVFWRYISAFIQDSDSYLFFYWLPDATGTLDNQNAYSPLFVVNLDTLKAVGFTGSQQIRVDDGKYLTLKSPRVPDTDSLYMDVSMLLDTGQLLIGAGFSAGEYGAWSLSSANVSRFYYKLV